MSKALAIADKGGPPQVQDVVVADPGPGQVRVRVGAASVNGIDMATAAGYLWDAFTYTFPVVLGRDFAGTVEAVGDGVEGFAPGDAVAGVVTAPDLHTGTMTQTLLADAGILTRAADTLPAEQAAATGLAALAAAGMVDGLDLTAGDVVLVAGATGGVGSYATQLAAATGADVLATARSPEGERFVTSLGATAAVDYSEDLEAKVRKVAPNGVTAVLHSAGDAAQLGDLLRRGGRLASVLGATGEQVGRYDVNVTGVAAEYSPERHRDLLADVAAGRLVAPIGHLYALDEATEAFADFNAPKLGKLVILTD